MIHRGCVKGFIFPDGQGASVTVAAEEGNGYFCETCGKPLTGLQRKHCSKSCECKGYYSRNKGRWKAYKVRQRAQRPGNEDVGHVKR